MPSTVAGLNECVWGEYLKGQERQIPELPDVTHLSKRLVRVLAGNPGVMQLQGTNTYLVGSGTQRILIDTGQGFRHWIDKMTQVLESLNVEISHVLLTHWHGDHTGGVPDLIAYQPKYSDRIYKCNPDSGQIGIEDGQVFQVEGATLRAVFTPGHADDHMCFVFEEENALFTGDNVLGHGMSVHEDLGAFTQSLIVMENLQCQIGYSAHGEVISDLPSKMEACRGQKEAHERQVHQGLTTNRARANSGKGSIALPDLVRNLYGELPDDVFHSAVAPSVAGTLAKLAEDRKVGFAMVNGERQWFARERRSTRAAGRAGRNIMATRREAVAV